VIIKYEPHVLSDLSPYHTPLTLSPILSRKYDEALIITIEN
jgi:hypothetical protein